MKAMLFPDLVDRAYLDVDDTENDRLENRLMMAFEAEPLEDGIEHPAELLVDDALRSMNGLNVLTRLGGPVRGCTRPGFAASVLRCLGRRRPGTSAWRVEILRFTLLADDVEMRDAAVQAAESWTDPGILEVLSSHVEEVPWLRTCIGDVAKDLGAQEASMFLARKIALAKWDAAHNLSEGWKKGKYRLTS